MLGKMHLGGYNTTLEKLICDMHCMANQYAAASHRLSGDKRDLLLRHAQEKRQFALALTDEYKALFCHEPESAPCEECKDITIKELVRFEADCAVHFSHMHKSAPNKRLSIIFKDIAEKATNNGYILLLIL